MKAQQFLSYLINIYGDAFTNNPTSNGAKLYESASKLLFHNNCAQIALIGHYVMGEALSYNEMLGDKIDIQDLKQYLNNVTTGNF
jgi:hypothetical protein